MNQKKIIQKTLAQHHVKKVTGKQKSLKKLDLLDRSGTYVINGCDVRKGVLVANLMPRKKDLFFY